MGRNSLVQMALNLRRLPPALPALLSQKTTKPNFTAT